MQKTVYKTKQSDLLDQFLESSRGKHFTAEDIKLYFSKKNINMGTATIYRHLERLVCEHKINKYFIDEHSAACFEYTGQDSCPKDHSHFHLKCEECGSLIHLECEELEIIQKHIMEEHGFKLDFFRTVFYGICSDCEKKKNA